MLSSRFTCANKTPYSKKPINWNTHPHSRQISYPGLHSPHQLVDPSDAKCLRQLVALIAAEGYA